MMKIDTTNCQNSLVVKQTLNYAENVADCRISKKLCDKKMSVSYHDVKHFYRDIDSSMKTDVKFLFYLEYYS